MIIADEPEEKVLDSLDRILRAKPLRAFLDMVVARVEQQLEADPAALMAWEPVPLDVYDTPLPGSIRSSWVFILRAGVATGAERHPNSRQRMMSYRAAGDLQPKPGERWESHLLASEHCLPLQQRWVSIGSLRGRFILCDGFAVRKMDYTIFRSFSEDRKNVALQALLSAFFHFIGVKHADRPPFAYPRLQPFGRFSVSVPSSPTTEMPQA